MPDPRRHTSHASGASPGRTPTSGSTFTGAALPVCGVDVLVVVSAVLGVTGWLSCIAKLYPLESDRLMVMASRGVWARAGVLYRVLSRLFNVDTEVKLVQ